MIPSLTSKTRFFELFIKNKNLIIQGLYLLEICQNAAGSTDRHGLRRPILMQFLLLLSSLPSTASMTDLHRHNGPSRVFVSKHLNSWNMGTGTTSLNIMTKPAGRTVIDTTDRHELHSSTLGQTSPSSFSSCTTLPPTDHHKLCRWSLLHFFAQILRIHLCTDFLQNKEKLI